MGKIIPLLTLLLLSSAAFFCTSGQGDSSPFMDMVFIKGGEFMMGSETGEADERPVHKVRLESFYMGRTEVTVGQWRVFVKESGYVSQAEQKGGGLVQINKKLQNKADANWKNPYQKQTEHHPVVLVSWNDAWAFCRWLSKKTGQYYHLPTEAEWEYACRAGTKTERYGDLETISWYEYNSGGNTHPVAGKQPNAFGLYDMLGNVWEWCNDYYDGNYYSVSPQAHPAGPISGTQRISRGGTWCSKPPRIRAAFRRHDGAGFRFYRLGFRVARNGQ